MREMRIWAPSLARPCVSNAVCGSSSRLSIRLLLGSCLLYNIRVWMPLRARCYKGTTVFPEVGRAPMKPRFEIRRVGAALCVLSAVLGACDDIAAGTDGLARITVSVSGVDWYAYPGETVHINVTYRGELLQPYSWDEELGQTEFERSEIYDVSEAGVHPEPTISVAGLREGSWRITAVVGMTWSTSCIGDISSNSTTHFSFADRQPGCEIE